MDVIMVIENAQVVNVRAEMKSLFALAGGGVHGSSEGEHTAVR